MSNQIEKLRYWTQRILPQVYDDSLSYYELLNKVVAKLNEVIDMTNEYFKEDLMTHVSNILKEWYENGKLKQIINDEVFKDITDNLDYNNRMLENMEVKNKLYRKEIFKVLPLWFEDYGQAILLNESDYIYPQSFTIDWETREIFILYEPSLGGGTDRWIVVRDLDTTEYKTCFRAGNSGGEGIVIKYENGNRFLYVKTQDGKLGKFTLDQFPTRFHKLQPIIEYDVGLAFNFSYRNGRWLIEQGGESYGTYQRRSVFNYYDDDFNIIGTINIRPEIGGYFSSPYSPFIPKRQGIALGDEKIYQATGGSYRIDTPPPTPYSYQGIKVLNADGTLYDEGLIHPEKYMSQLYELGFVSDRVENEGIHVAPNGDVYTLNIHLLYTTSEAAKETGIIIFKEMSDSPDAIDFVKGNVFYPKIDAVSIENGAFPRNTDGKMYDPYLGTELNTFDKIMDMMWGVELKEFSFYSNEVPVTDLNGDVVPPNTYVKIYNTNNWTFVVSYKSTTDGASKDFVVYGKSGERSQTEIKTQNKQLTELNGSALYRYGVDLNNLRETGWYYMDSGAPNNPNGTYGFLEVIASVTTAVQFFHPVTNVNLTYKRLYQQSTGWTDWVQV